MHQSADSHKPQILISQLFDVMLCDSGPVGFEMRWLRIYHSEWEPVSRFKRTLTRVCLCWSGSNAEKNLGFFNAPNICLSFPLALVVAGLFVCTAVCGSGVYVTRVCVCIEVFCPWRCLCLCVFRGFLPLKRPTEMERRLQSTRWRYGNQRLIITHSGSTLKQIY